MPLLNTVAWTYQNLGLPIPAKKKDKLYISFLLKNNNLSMKMQCYNQLIAISNSMSKLYIMLESIRMVISRSDQKVTYITFTIIVHRASFRPL